MTRTASRTLLLVTALASAVLLLVLVPSRRGSGAGQRVTHAKASPERGVPDIADLPGPLVPAADGSAPPEANRRPPVHRAPATTVPIDQDTWHFRVRTASRSRRAEGHRFVIELGSAEEATGRSLVRGRTDRRGRADVTWAPPPGLADAERFTCRLAEDDCIPHRVDLCRFELDGRRRAKAFLRPEAYSRAGVQAVDAEGEPVACTFFLVKDGVEPEELERASLGYMRLPARLAEGPGALFAWNRSHGTGRVRLAELGTGEGEPHRLTLRAEGGARGRVVTASGAPLPRARLRLQWMPEDGAPLRRGSTDSTARRTFTRVSDMPEVEVVIGAREGMGEALVTTDRDGRFGEPLLCPGRFDVRLVFGERGEVSIGTLESAPGTPETELMAPYAWVSFKETRRDEHVRAVFDVTDGGSAAIGEGPSPVEPTASAPLICVGNQRRALLRTGRVYEAVQVHMEGGGRTIVRSNRFELADDTPALTVDLR